jgi:hypothetical protein
VTTTKFANTLHLLAMLCTFEPKLRTGYNTKRGQNKSTKASHLQGYKLGLDRTVNIYTYLHRQESLCGKVGDLKFEARCCTVDPYRNHGLPGSDAKLDINIILS